MNHAATHRPDHHSEETRMLAYYLWQQAHCPPGQDLYFWLKAERQLFGKRDQPPAAKAKTKEAGTAKAAAKGGTAPAGNGSAKRQPGTIKNSARAR